MTDSFYDDAGEFTMVSHLLAQEVGLVCAAVYGAVWRHCQKKDGICKASLDTLGSEIHLDRATVMRSIKKLVQLNYLTDQTPGRRNAPHTYTLAKSVALCNSLTDTGVVIRNSPEGKTVAENNKSVAYNNSSIETVAQSKATVAESHLKKDSLETLQETKQQEENKGKPPPKRQPDFGKVCDTYQQEIGGMSQSISDALDDDIKTYSADWVILAMNRAAKQNKRRLSYVEGILSNWQSIGGPQNDQPASERQSKKPTDRSKNEVSTFPPPPDPIPPPALTPEEATWQKALSDIRQQLPPWLAADIRAIFKRSNGTFKLAVSTEGAKEWIDNRLKDKIIQPALNRIDKSVEKVEVIVQ